MTQTSQLRADAETLGAGARSAHVGPAAPAVRATTSAAVGLRPAPPPATGAWRHSDPTGNRRFARIGRLTLDSGRALEDVTVAYETWGELSPEGDNAILILHALTGDSHVRGPAGPGHPTPGWWEELVGPGRAIDTDRWFVVAPNVLGGCQGTTGPASTAPDGRPYAARFPAVTPRDQVAAEHRLMRELGLARWALVVGGSMGGMRALEWAIEHPDRVERLAVIASGAAASADQLAWNCAQSAAIRACEGYRGGDYYDAPAGAGPHAGLGVARRIAHTTYRTAEELESRFSRSTRAGGSGTDAPDFEVASYLDHHADKLARRFDANSYLVLVGSMDSHDVGRGRGGIDGALARISARTLVVAVDTDRLFPVAMSERIACGVEGALLRVIRSDIGHDGFLVSAPALSGWIRGLLEG